VTTVAEAFVELMPSFRGGQAAISRQLGGPLDGAGREGGTRFGTGMTGAIGGMASRIFAPLAAAAAGVSIGAILKDSITQASGLQEAGTKLTAIFGKDGSAAVQKFADTGAKALGQDKLSVLDAAATFGTFGKAADLTGKPLADFSTGFATLSTDLASFHNVSPEEAVSAIGSALRGEAEPMRRFGVLMDDASLKAEAMKQGLISSTKEALTPQQKVLAAQGLIYAQTADAQGDFGRTSGGLANQQRILSAQVTDLKGRIGEKLLPAVTTATTFLTDNMIPGIEKAGGFLKDLGTTIVGIVVPAFKDAKKWIDENKTAAIAIASTIGAVLLPIFVSVAVQATVSAAKQVAAFVAARVASVTSAASQLASHYKVVFGWVLSGAAAVKSGAQTVAIWALYKIEAIKGAAASVISAARVVASWVVMSAGAVANAAKVVGAWLLQKVAALGSLIPLGIAVAATVAGWVLMAVQSMIQAVRMAAAWFIALGPVGWVIGIVIGLVALIIANWDTIVKWTKAAWDWVFNAVKSAWTFILGIVQAHAAWVVGMIVGLRNKIIATFTALKAGALAIWGAIKQWIADRITDIVATALKIVAFKDKVVAGFQALKDQVVSKITAFVTEVKGLPAKVLAAVSNFASLLKNKGRDLIQGLIDGVTDKIAGIKAAMSKVTDAIGKFLPGSPIKAGALVSWNNGGAGKRLVGMIATGLEDTGPLARAMSSVASTVNAPLTAGASLAGFSGGGASVRVFIGERELTDIVRVEVDGHTQTQARALSNGRRV
jgi:hypothetical protein